ncbi:hypothetical protein Hanom_Chr06g00552141 [Helianthus anomalus]
MVQSMGDLQRRWFETTVWLKQCFVKKTVVSTSVFSTKNYFYPIKYYPTVVSTTVFFKPNLIIYSL